MESRPSTASIDELDYQEHMRQLYVSLFPELDAEAFVLGVSIQRLAARMRLQMDTVIYQPAGYSIAHIRILMALAAVGPTTPTELARFTQVSPSSVSSVLRNLRRSGHVQVAVPDDQTDGRVKVVSLLPEGLAVMKELMGSMRPLEEEWAATLGPVARERVVRYVRRMAAELEHPKP